MLAIRYLGTRDVMNEDAVWGLLALYGEATGQEIILLHLGKNLVGENILFERVMWLAPGAKSVVIQKMGDEFYTLPASKYKNTWLRQDLVYQRQDSLIQKYKDLREKKGDVEPEGDEELHKVVLELQNAVDTANQSDLNSCSEAACVSYDYYADPRHICQINNTHAWI